MYVRLCGMALVGVRLTCVKQISFKIMLEVNFTIKENGKINIL